MPTTGARRRRRSMAGQKACLQKGTRRNTKMRSLKIGSGKVRGRIFTLVRCLGSPGTRVKPVRPQEAQTQAARINRHQKLGSVVTAVDMKEFVGDPLKKAVGQHWRSVSKILAKHPSWVSRTWQVLWRLTGASGRSLQKRDSHRPSHTA